MLYTIGYEKRSAEEFYGLLESHDIRHVLDVRSRPNGRRYEFNRKAMAGKTRGYEWVGDRLGGFGVITDQAIENLAEQLRRFGKENAVLVCYERNPQECHRYYEICRRLEPHGITALHL